MVREGNKLLSRAATVAELRDAASAVRAMLAVLGSTRTTSPGRAAAPPTPRPGSTGAVDVLVASLLEQRAAARADKDFAAADAIRDQLKEAGIEIDDTPQGPRWSL